MDLLETLAEQLKTLQQQAQQIDAAPASGKPQNWFDSTLFSCRSIALADYVAEAQRNLVSLRRNQLSDASRLRLVQRLSEQTAALTQAFRNTKIRRKNGSKTTKVKAVLTQISASSQQLYQQLSDIQEFERRLLDMIHLAERDTSADGVQRTLALHARLGRCRKALSETERQIQDLERRS
ncbi:primosomal replication protein PriC [Rheinheimera sp.]|uniref:primosomal replication protein PriC n=1 Tax=Rheinheimera sp. TaxID=1869214 RepID=UPI0037CA0F2D|tara:strand:+ start:6974 stop:7513 length:540 start_codon:yes stop_codon:yes gene_type:complete